ncbi:MAG: chemotaxis protein CheC [Bacteroidia bacterium]
MDIVINDIEKDILKEIVNIGLAKAADSFATIARDKVFLSVPDVQIVDPSEMTSFIAEGDRSDAVIQSDIKGDLNGKTFILFPEKQSAYLADVCVGPVADFKGNYPAMKRSLLLEISNMLTGSIVTQLANIFKVNIYGSAPVAVPFGVRKSFSDLISDFPVFKPFILTVNTQFINSGRLVELPLIIVFDMDTVVKILEIIREQTKLNKYWLS